MIISASQKTWKFGRRFSRKLNIESGFKLTIIPGDIKPASKKRKLKTKFKIGPLKELKETEKEQMIIKENRINKEAFKNSTTTCFSGNGNPNTGLVK